MKEPKRRCQVYGCKEKGTVKCDSGFRYCATHTKPHGQQKSPHKFKRLPKIKKEPETLYEFIKG